jgi:uncharacterized membrane protein YdjX (TVP38/TMEM64 family)
VAIIATIVPVAGSVTTVLSAPFVAPWLRSQGTAGVLMVIVCFAVLGAVAFAPTYSTSVLAGWTFGFAVGFPTVVGGTVAGAMMCYALARRVAGRRVAATFEEHPRWEVVRQALIDASPLRTLWLVFLLRLSPVLPFGTTNVLLATTGVGWRAYLLGTLLGLVPRTGLIALAAASAERLELDAAEGWGLLAAGIVATGLFIVVLAVAGKRALDRATVASSSASA